MKGTMEPVPWAISEIHPEEAMVMFFFDEAGDLEEYQTFRKQDQPLELVHLELRVALKEAEGSLRVHPGDREAQTRVDELKRKLAELDRQAPWITLDYPLEYLLWGPPHG
jgi:hypothetical protein